MTWTARESTIDMIMVVGAGVIVTGSVSSRLEEVNTNTGSALLPSLRRTGILREDREHSGSEVSRTTVLRPKRPTGPIKATPENPRLWREIALGSTIHLSDLPTFEGTPPIDAPEIDLEVKRKRVIAIQNDQGRVQTEYVVLNLADVHAELFLIAVIADQRVDLRVYYTPEEIQPGNREDMIAEGMTWFFCAPEDPDDFTPGELEYARYPGLPPINDGGEERQISFEGTPVGPAYGEYRVPFSNRATPVVIIEYVAMEPCASPLLIVIEEDGLDSLGDPLPEGGMITVMMGKTIKPGAIRIVATGR